MSNILMTLTHEHLIFIWLGIFIVSLIIELITTELVSIYSCIGAIVSTILAACKVPFWPQLWVYILVVIITLLTTRPIFIKFLKKNEIKTNVDSLVGKRLKLTKEITSSAFGEVVVYGVIWNVVSQDNSSIAVNSEVEVLSLEGSKLIVKEIK